jgi:hypothetical protein
MRSLDRKGRTLEEVVEELLTDENLDKIDEPAVKAKIKIQRLKGEMRKYLNRPKIFAAQIDYIKKKIREIEEQYPEAKVNFYERVFQ